MTSKYPGLASCKKNEVLFITNDVLALNHHIHVECNILHTKKCLRCSKNVGLSDISIYVCLILFYTIASVLPTSFIDGELL